MPFQVRQLVVERSKLESQGTVVRGIRGATIADQNEPETIYQVTGALLEQLLTSNRLATEQIAAIFFSTTPDLNSAFPAKAARRMGWTNVPLFCQAEIDVPEAMARCIRILILVNTNLAQDQIEHVYLNGTAKLKEL